MLAGSLTLAFASSALFALGYYGQHHGARNASTLSLRRPVEFVRMLISSRAWLIGYGANWIGWGAYIAALDLGPLSLVQVVSAGTLGILVLITTRLGSRPSLRETLGAGLSTAGLVLILVSAHSPLRPRVPSLATVLSIVAIGLALSCVVLAILRQRRGTALGIVSGLMYGVGDIATKAAVAGRSVLVPVFLFCVASAFISLQLAFQRGSLFGTAAVSSVLANVIPIVAGLVLFGEGLPGGWESVSRSLGFIFVITGAVSLATDNSAAASPRPSPRRETSPRTAT